jgi:hypothetical protein
VVLSVHGLVFTPAAFQVGGERNALHEHLRQALGITRELSAFHTIVATKFEGILGVFLSRLVWSKEHGSAPEQDSCGAKTEITTTNFFSTILTVVRN